MTTPTYDEDTNPTIPTVDCHVVKSDGGRDLWAFDCPHCWRYGATYGVGNIWRSDSSRRPRPRTARPLEHVHAPEPGFRVAHCCHHTSPFTGTGYRLRLTPQEETS